MRHLLAATTTHAPGLGEANLGKVLPAVAALEEGNRTDLSANA